MTVARRLEGPSPRAAHGAAVTRHRDKHTAAPPTKAPRCGAIGSPRTASTPPRNHISLGAGALPALGAAHESGQIVLESTRKKVITIEISDGSVRGLMNERATAMSGTTLDTAGIGGEARGPGGLPFNPWRSHLGMTDLWLDSFCKWLTLDLVMNLEMESRGWRGALQVGLGEVHTSPSAGPISATALRQRAAEVDNAHPGGVDRC